MRIYRSLFLGDGFTLITTIFVLTLLAMIAVGLLSLSSVTLSSTRQVSAMDEARANARVALILAIGQLQKAAGPDQRVTAHAEVVETELGAAGGGLENPYWTGVWRNYVEGDGVSYHLVGKSSGVNNAPYKRSNGVDNYHEIYTDLRETDPDLNKGAWKRGLLEEWLVSQRLGHLADPQSMLNGLGDSVELLGKGGLGTFNPVILNQENVTVPLIDQLDGEGEVSGRMAWWTSDDNLKANISLSDTILSDEVAIHAPGHTNPTQLKNLSGGSEKPLRHFVSESLRSLGKVVSFETAELAAPSSADELDSYRHHLTVYSAGLFTNPITGGLKKDLTSMLFSASASETVSFVPPYAHTSPYTITSAHPIIPSVRHDMLGPKLGALRDWGRLKYRYEGEALVEYESVIDSKRGRPSSLWPYGENDGNTFNIRGWAESAPKLHPVMVDVRYHYYFTFGHVDGNGYRAHFVPRVCLWNPYSREMRINDDELEVKMPNLFRNGGNAHFKYPDEKAIGSAAYTSKQWRSVAWHEEMADGYYAKFPLEHFSPDGEFFSFKLAATTLAPGECLIFTASSTAELALDENLLSAGNPINAYNFFKPLQATNGIKVKGVNSSGNNADLSPGISNLPAASDVHDYRVQIVRQQGHKSSFAFFLRSIPSDTTLQTVLNSIGGDEAVRYMEIYGDQMGTAAVANQQVSAEQPTIMLHNSNTPWSEIPNTHVIGTKLLWLNEDNTEASYQAPIRGPLWRTSGLPVLAPSDQILYNAAPVANWNIRAPLVAASPVSQQGGGGSSAQWALFSTQPWALQLNPRKVGSGFDDGLLNEDGLYRKHPLGMTLDFTSNPNLILFDLPHAEYGALSMASLRHAHLTPYSWHPSYIIGQSIRDLHAPLGQTALDSMDAGSFEASSWDGYVSGSYSVSQDFNSEGTLQVGGDSVSDTRTGASSSDDILAYDIAYEINQNFWDYYFLSGLPLGEDDTVFTRQVSDQPRYRLSARGESLPTPHDSRYGFYLNAYHYLDETAFNINSTSPYAWQAFLSATLGVNRPVSGGASTDGSQVSFARTDLSFESQENSGEVTEEGALGARFLSELEIAGLAQGIVDEVKLRGPFISLADFINRRLVAGSDGSNQAGVIDSAIASLGLNDGYSSERIYQKESGIEFDSNDSDFQECYLNNGESSAPDAKAFGLPGYLMQGDILESLAPHMTVRGDTFTIRSYGDSVRGGLVIAKCWLEAVVVRGADYVEAGRLNTASKGVANPASDAATVMDPLTGVLSAGNLSLINQKFGRRFRVLKMKWLDESEI